VITVSDSMNIDKLINISIKCNHKKSVWFTEEVLIIYESDYFNESIKKKSKDKKQMK